ncbi:hypothetical protein RHECNPAF_6420036 [Rhizobium etli CNPAF512]|nr:hypothetical protein RHECNPAF_6420036 [Rhizobium etli CNPAF512]
MDPRVCPPPGVIDPPRVFGTEFRVRPRGGACASGATPTNGLRADREHDDDPDDHLLQEG